MDALSITDANALWLVAVMAAAWGADFLFWRT